MLVKCIIVKSMLCTIVILSFQVLRRKRKAGAVVAQGVGPPRNKVWVEKPGLWGLARSPRRPALQTPSHRNFGNSPNDSGNP